MCKAFRTESVVILAICLLFIAKLQGAEASNQLDTLNHSQTSLKDSKLIVELDLFKSTQPEQLSIAINSFVEKIKDAPPSDPWISKCEYTIGLALYNTGSFSEAIRHFDRCLDAKETFPGDHIYALQMKMLCLTELKQYENAAITAEKISQISAPRSIRELLAPRAIFLGAQMRINADNGDGKQRSLAEKDFIEALSNTNITDLLSADELQKMEAGTVRQRIQNSLVLGQTNLAKTISLDFLKKHPTNYYAPLIALELKRIVRGRLNLPVSDLQEIERNYNLNSGAGANVLYDLAVVSADKGDWQMAVDASQKVISMKLSSDDPMPISLTLLSELIKIRTTSYLKTGRTNDALKSAAALNAEYSSQIEFNLTNSVQSDNKSGLHKNNFLIRIVLLVVMLIPPLIMAFVVLRRKTHRNQG